MTFHYIIKNIKIIVVCLADHLEAIYQIKVHFKPIQYHIFFPTTLLERSQ